MEILLECYQAQYFFPGRYNHYSGMILRIKTKCEKVFVESLNPHRTQPISVYE
jgi:hypothetical protein